MRREVGWATAVGGSAAADGGGSDRFARRIAAYALDCALLFAVLAPASFGIQQLLGIRPGTGPGIWLALLIGFSVPTWSYFALADASPRGATVGKRMLGIRVASTTPRRIGASRAVLRTALKLLPWELTHFFAFALSPEPGTFGPCQGAGLAAAWAIALGFLWAALRTRGRRSVHDVLVSTEVVRAS